MSTSNTFESMKPNMKDTYSDTKRKDFKKIKSNIKQVKCSCKEKCSCKKK